MPQFYFRALTCIFISLCHSENNFLFYFAVPKVFHLSIFKCYAQIFMVVKSHQKTNFYSRQNNLQPTTNFKTTTTTFDDNNNSYTIQTNKEIPISIQTVRSIESIQNSTIASNSILLSRY